MQFGLNLGRETKVFLTAKFREGGMARKNVYLLISAK